MCCHMKGGVSSIYATSHGFLSDAVRIEDQTLHSIHTRRYIYVCVNNQCQSTSNICVSQTNLEVGRK